MMHVHRDFDVHDHNGDVDVTVNKEWKEQEEKS